MQHTFSIVTKHFHERASSYRSVPTFKRYNLLSVGIRKVKFIQSSNYLLSYLINYKQIGYGIYFRKILSEEIQKYLVRVFKVVSGGC